MIACPIPAPSPKHVIHHGKPTGTGGIQYEPPIGISNVRAWLFTWAGLGQWVTPTYIPQGEHWVAVKPRRGAT